MTARHRTRYVVAWHRQHRCAACGRFLDHQPDAHGSGAAWCRPCGERLDARRAA